MLTRALGAIGLALSLPTGGFAQIGTNYCTPSVPNTTGIAARISATGSSNLTLNSNRLYLQAENLPLNQFGFFVTSRTQALVANPGGSQGNLCLGGTLGRYVGAAQVLNAGSTGSFQLLVDLALTPEGGSFVQVAPGETWNFQAWYRDFGSMGQASSNFTDGLEVLFTGGAGAPIPGMMPIPAGTFMMGSDAPNAAPYFNNGNQQPVHQVTISYAFWMGQHEVTQAEYQALVLSNPSAFVGPTRPVEVVTWGQARAYCTALTAQETLLGNMPPSYEYRLPTEAEWEYACRAGTTTEFHHGPDLFCNQARFSYSYHSSPPAPCVHSGGTVPVGGYAPNAFGLYDMHGNVLEWCLDSYAAYSSPAVVDPFVTGGPFRVIRGGSWFDGSSSCRSAFRGYSYPGFSYFFLGFRVVLAPVLVP